MLLVLLCNYNPSLKFEGKKISVKVEEIAGKVVGPYVNSIL